MIEFTYIVDGKVMCGSYSIYHGEKWNGQKVKTKLTPEGKVITKIL